MGPAEGPIGLTKGAFIVVGATSIANHQVA